MEDQKKRRRRKRTPARVAPQRQNNGQTQRKAFNYILQLGADDREVLARYQDALTRHAGQFAEAFYNYLFDIPEIAEVLYAYERKGGDSGNLIKSQLHHLLSLLDDEPPGDIHAVGSLYFKRQVKPVWLIGAYRLYLNHLLECVSAMPEIPEADRQRLHAALSKRVFLDLGLVLQAYWGEAYKGLQQETAHIRADYARISDLLANIPQLFWSAAADSCQLLYASPAAEAFAHGDASGPVPALSRFPADDRESILAAWERARQGRGVAVEARMLANDGAERWYRLMFYPCPASDQAVERVDAVMQDVTENRATLARLEHLATTDELTNLANRTVWYDRANQAIAAARRAGDSKVVLMLLDLNHFKMVNDTLGHSAGDELLREVATRLRQVLRDSDTLARLGGDEFAILLPCTKDPRKAGKRVAETVLSCFRDAFYCQGQEFLLGTSMGIAVYPEHGEDVDRLLSHADIAMYRAKRAGIGSLFYDPGKDASSVRHLQLSGQLHRALERGEFELHYQPKVDIHGMRVSGAEALLRWRHPEEGLLAPDRFIQVAEQAGLMMPITNWVLVTALCQCKEWWLAGARIPISVNVSARSFQTPRLLDRVQWALKEAGVDGECLEIEITEEAIMSDLEHGSEILSKLSNERVGLAIDDFGTGYSSLAYLKRLPIDTLKIDRSFLLDMAENENDAVLVRSIIDLGHNLGFQVVAEGVEDGKVWDLLDILGCDAVQGYHVSPPLTRDRFSHWLKETPWQV
jgi:diguanylate cyclase (GGDEF)-like protein